MYDYNDAAYYFAFHEDGYYLLRLDDSNIPQPIKSAWPIGNFVTYHSVIYNGKLYYTASEYDYDDEDDLHGGELWVSDGTTSGTIMLKDIYPGMNDFDQPNASYPEDLTACNGKLFFIASDAEHGRELWVTDGTAAGTQLVKDINEGAADSYIKYMVVMNHKLYFVANTALNGVELWTSDGTLNGTHLVAETADGVQSFDPRQLTASSDKVYFVAKTDYWPNTYNYELWATDGETIWMVEDINGTSTGAVDVNQGFEVYNDKLYFCANDGIHGREVWVSDGTAAGTNMVKDIAEGAMDGGFYYPYIYNGYLYFKAFNTATEQKAIWRTNGTEEFTTAVMLLAEDLGDFVMPSYTPYNDKLYLYASLDQFGAQLCRYDDDNSSYAAYSPIDPPAIDAAMYWFMYSANNSIYLNANYGEVFAQPRLWRFRDGAVSINEEIKSSEVLIYPNPTSDELVVSLQANSNCTSVEVLDMSGRILDRTDIKNKPLHVWNVQHLASGVYFLKIYEGENTMMIKRFVKQ